MPITRLIPDRRLATALGVMVAAVSVSAASAGTTQQTLVSPAADSYVSSAKPQANYGLKSALKAERSPTMRGYLRFDVPSLPGDVTRATLRIFSSSGSNVGYDVRAVGDNSWGESTITYANAPSPSVATTASSGAYRSGTWTSLDVTPLVSGPGTVSFALTSKSTRALSVASRETGSTSPSLVVETAGPTVPSDTTPPTAPAGLAATSATASSVSVSWNASTDDVGVAGYTVYLDDKEFDVTPPTSRSYTLTGLACGASHVFAVDAYDAAGNYSARASVTTTTTPCVSDTTPPTTPTGLATTATTASSVSVSWAASTDDVGVTGYRVYRAGTLLGSTTQTGYTAGNLSCGVSYTLAVEAYDAAGNVSPKSSVTVFTSACTDTTPPTVLGLPTIAAATQTSITLSWTASLDNVGVAGYGVYLNGTLVGTTPLTTYAFVGLSCGTSYVLGVDAFDATGNRSTKTSVTAAASPCADTSPPTAPSNLQVTASTATSVSSSWTASTDNVGVSGYSLYVNGAKVGTATGTSYVFSSLSCGAGYTLSVEAFDTSGNVSGRTSLATATSACQAQTGSQIRWRFAYSNRSDQNLATSYGYNLIDVSTKSEADATPPGTQGQLWLYDYDNTTCTWEKDDTYITNMVSSTANDPKVAGYYFSNEPDPFACPNAPQQHKARNALIKSLAPTKYTLVGIDANWRSHFDAYGAMWVGTADYVNYNPYICYVGRSTCDFVWLDHVLQVAESLPQPYFVALQAFKEGTEWRWPTASEETQMLQKLCGTKAQGYLTFSWNWQNDPLLNHPDVLDAIKQFTVNGCGSPASDSTPPSSPSGLSGSPTTSSIALSWQASTDNVGVAGYDLYRDGAKVGNTTVPSYTFGGLSCGRGYTLGVEAYDATGNRSPRASLTTSTSTCSGGGGSADPVIAAAGDLCGSPTDCAPTASLLGQIDPDRVLTLGDNAYEDGTTSEYTDYYDPNWGKYKSKTSPAPGNHDYHTPGGAGYFGYFGAQAPAPYYSFDLGSWHLVSLNGEVSHSAGSAQETWLKSDLAAHSGQCVLAYWHEPRFSSGSEHGSDMSFDAVWRDLYAAGADIVLNGHEHDYERFAAQSPTGAADGKGIREFVVGTGGAGLYPFGTPLPNSEVRNSDTFGVLRLTLHPTGYDWRFVPVAGSSFSDSGSGSCN